MKNIIVYTSQTGFTEKYAKTLGEKISGEVITLKEAKKKSSDYFSDADCIIYAGWAMAGKVTGADWMIKRLPAFSGKKLGIVCVGASPVDSPLVKEVMDRVLTTEQRSYASLFYLPGGLDYDKMSAPSRLAMKAFASMLKKKKNPTEEEKEMAKLIGGNYDNSDPKCLDPVISFVQG